jgi:hypothetical protein
MRENLALTSLEMFDRSPSAEEIIGLCKNKKRGFAFAFSYTTAIDFMRVLKACPHIVL